jgi:hypothetical protein
MTLACLYFLEVVVLGRWLHWGLVHCITLSCLCTHFQDSLQFIQCYHVHAVKSAKNGFPSRPLQKFALFSSTLFTIKFHSELPPTLAGVLPASFSVSLSTLYTCCTTEAASGYSFVMAWHSDFSDASFCAQYFRNPSTGASAVLVCTQVHRLFCCFAQHCTLPRPGGKLHLHQLRQMGGSWSSLYSLGTDGTENTALNSYSIVTCHTVVNLSIALSLASLVLALSKYAALSFLRIRVHLQSSKWSVKTVKLALLLFHDSEVQILYSALHTQTPSISIPCPASEARLYEVKVVFTLHIKMFSHSLFLKPLIYFTIHSSTRQALYVYS